MPPGLCECQGAGAACAPESLISQIPQSAEPTTAGATGAFVDLNKDGCRRVGAGFTNLPSPPQDNAAPGVPYIVPGNAFDATGSPAVPGALSMPYGGGKFRTARRR